MEECVLKIAEELQYNKIQRLREKIAPDDAEELLTFLRSSIVGSFSILFFPNLCIEITPYGTKIHYLHSKISAEEHYILFHPRLEEKFLRKLFTGIELIIFKLCHIVLHDHSSSYNYDKETTSERFDQLKSLLDVSHWDDYKELFRDIIFVRNSFSHSFIEIEEIKYKRNPLVACFGRSSVGRSYRAAGLTGGSIFMDDVNRFFEPLAKCFSTHQLAQINKDQFFRLCDHFIKPRLIK